MVIPTYFKMIFSSHDGWEQVERLHFTVKTLFYMVLPLSVIPPCMILYAGFSYGGNYFDGANGVTWMESALVFLIAELITVPLMAWAIKSIAETRGITTDFSNTFAVAAIAAVPLWISSVALFISSPLVVIAIVLIGLIASISLVFHGIEGILHMHEDVEVATITYTVIGLGIVAWTLLIALIFLPMFL